MIAAKPTRYHGIQFRSQLEARWALFFDTLGIVWEYEKTWFEWREWKPVSRAWAYEQGDYDAYEDNQDPEWEAEYGARTVPRQYTYRYKPDFWLPAYSVWVEVKGRAPSDLEREYAERLCRETKHAVYLVSGLPAALGNARKFWWVGYVERHIGLQEEVLTPFVNPLLAGAAYLAARTAHFNS